MLDLICPFVQKVSGKSEFQKKYLENWSITSSEKKELNAILHFFLMNSTTIWILLLTHIYLSTIWSWRKHIFFFKTGDIEIPLLTK